MSYTGKIIKGIAGFYYVDIKDKGLYECKAKGKFRNNKIKNIIFNIKNEIIAMQFHSFLNLVYKGV